MVSRPVCLGLNCLKSWLDMKDKVEALVSGYLREMFIHLSIHEAHNINIRSSLTDLCDALC